MHRRGFLSGLIGCSAAASPLLTPVVFAQAPWDARLVVILLRGAMDGLDVVRPARDPNFAMLRPKLSVQEGAIPLGGIWEMNAGLGSLAPLWRAEQLGFVHAVSTPYRDRRSHFDGQDILEAGGTAADGLPRSGWLNRLVGETPSADAASAFAIGRDEMMILSGDAPVSSWSPDARLGLTPQARLLLGRLYQGDPLFEQASSEAIEIADQIAQAGREPRPEIDGVNAGSQHARIAAFAASRLKEDTRIASFSLSGWDTHDGQARSMRNALGRLSDTILTLKAELGPVWAKTAVLCLTEFGRTAAENGTQGTDHGTGGAMIYAGGALRGGQVVGDWPGLAEEDLYGRRDLMPTRDVRAIAGWVMRDLTGVDASILENTIFPGLELGPRPSLIL